MTGGGEICIDLALLVEELRQAERCDDPRDAVGEALKAVLGFIRGIPEVRSESLDAPILAIIIALIDLKKSTVAPMLRGGKSPNGHQAPTARRLMKAYCSYLVERLLGAGHSLETSCKIVAGALEGSAILRGHRTENWQKIKNWRDGAAKLATDNDELALLEALRAEASEIELSPEHVTAMVRRLDAKIGRFG